VDSPQHHAQVVPLRRSAEQISPYNPLFFEKLNYLLLPSSVRVLKNKCLKNTLKKADVWSPTKIKSGDPKGKTGNEWCKAEADGGALEDCVSFWNDITLERFKCDEKSG